jgi:diaminohydroxyphosphoribosylaminopyrimidine deaminase/5-amino-6-(5-phosphoribosylamino)uracil reductase
MHELSQDERFLQSALNLAREAAAFASPNPSVGCVLVRGDEVLGEGAHLYDARDHAEIAALKDADSRGHDVRGATAYVTLEPCSHHGRTGPCSDALIAANIARCVIATVDPNPVVRGSGIAKLHNAEIEVALADPVSPLAAEARELNDAFAFSIQHHRPFVTLKAALSVDGKLAPPASQRTAAAPHWLTGEASRADVQRLRHASDAILTGIGTVLADNPSLTDRTGLPRRRPLLRVVLDSDLRIPLKSSLVVSAANDLLVVCHPFASEIKEKQLTDCGVHIERVDGEAGQPSLRGALEALHQRQIRSVLLEAGSRLNGSFLFAKLVDELVLYYSETELGADAVPFADGIASPYVLQQQLQHVTRQAFANDAAEDVRISGYVHDPWASADLIPIP